MNATTVKSNAGRVLKVVILPLAIYLVMLISTGGRFGMGNSMTLVLRQSVIPILIALAIGCNMTIGMWDFSAGGVVMTAAFLGGYFAKETGAGIVGMLVICMAVAIGLTMLTGLLYNLMKVPSLVLTVGLVMVYEAIPRLLSLTRVQINIKDGVLSQSPWCFIILIGMFVLFYIVFNYTTFGFNVKAIGANQAIANSAGVNLSKTKFIAFTFGGVFLGVAATLYMSNMTTLVPPTAFGSVGLIFDAMMGIFVAFFLQRYCNFAIGIVIGTIAMQMLNSGLVALGLETTMRDITSGLFLLVLLIVSSNQGRIEDIRTRKQLARKANEQYKILHTSRSK